jgi:glycosyltransferase involved in cell wall biosynthesis
VVRLPGARAVTRVVVVDEGPPFPPDSGKRIRTFELLRRLAAEFSVRVVFPRDPGDPESSLEALRRHGVEPVPVPRRAPRKRGARFAWDLARNLWTPRPYMAMAHRSRAVAARVAEEAREADLVHVEWTPLVVNVPDDVAVRVCVSAHNVEADVWDRAVTAERGAARRAYLALQAAKVRRFEVTALRRADHVLAVSDSDAERLRERTGRPVTVVENGVDAERFAPDPSAPVDPDRLVFVGSLDWRPNQDAVVWFVDQVLPRLRARRPATSFAVVGRAPPDGLVRRLSGLPGVVLHASVPDVRAHLATAAACVVPLRIGGGSRLKICEALAMGRPVVSTTIGAEGLHLDGGVVLADGADAFARAAARVLADPREAAALAARGRAAVLERHEWGRLARVQAEIWRALASRRERIPA